MRPKLRGIYLVSPPQIDDSFIPLLETALQNAAGVCAFQLRLKQLAPEEIIAWAVRIKFVLGNSNIPFIINDNPLIAKTVEADGVHLGADDGDMGEARKLLGADALIGASAYDSLEKAQRAARAGADYVCFGAFFATSTKKTTTRARPELLRQWKADKGRSAVALGAIGGITSERAPPLFTAGADFLAVSSAVWQARDPAAAIASLTAAHHLLK